MGTACCRLQLHATSYDVFTQDFPPNFSWALHTNYFYRDSRSGIDDYHGSRIYQRFRGGRDWRPPGPGTLPVERWWKVHPDASRSICNVRPSLPDFVSSLFTISSSAINIPNMYSCALSIQALGRPFARVPRFFWTLLIFVIVTVAGVAGREHFSEILSVSFFSSVTGI